MKKITNRHITIIIIVLLFIIAFPIMKTGYKTICEAIANQIESNKKAYCQREYPAYVQKAMTTEELQNWVDELLEKDKIGSWDGVFQNNEFNNPKGLSTRQMLLNKYNWLLKDKQYHAAFYDEYVNKCQRGMVYITDELPWYKF